MKTLLLSACAAALIATAGAPASAGQFTMNDNGPSGPVIGVGDYYDGNANYDNDWRYQSPGYNDEDSTYKSDYSYGNRSYGYEYHNGYGSSGYGYGNGNSRVVPPYAIVRNLHRNSFTYISQPMLAGRFYQVKARDPHGHRVKLYVDAYNGRIAKVKY